MNTKSKLLTGNEAIARGAWEAGVTVAAAYPGTPSTEILESLSTYDQVYAQWSVNEKVALEIASGASMEGARTLVAMKHVGLNVAADPFMTLAYTGVGGGLVIVTADDPAMHSSQNEQDNRYYALMAKVPLLEPSDSQEAKQYVIEAFRLSEKYDTPVLLRTTTRVSHSKSEVELLPRLDRIKPEYAKDSSKYVMIPGYGRPRRTNLINRWNRLAAHAENSPLHYIYRPACSQAPEVGMVTSGISYQYAREVFTGIDILKLGITCPLPQKLIQGFARGKKLLLVAEELEPFLEDQIKALGLGVEVAGKQYFPQQGELSLAIMKEAYTQLFGSRGQSPFSPAPQEVPSRPPVLCAGCSHRPVFYVLHKLKVRVMGDIGCYSLAVLPPLNAMDSLLCMGAGVGQALGMEKANPDIKGKVVSVIGDSTFFHSGITSLVDSVYNQGTGVIIILDNRTTAMTGHQANPGMGSTLQKEQVPVVLPEKIAEAAGVKNIQVVDPYQLEQLEKVIKKELARDELSVIVCRQECVLLKKEGIQERFFIDQAVCRDCGVCLKFGCPAIQVRKGKYLIDGIMCTSCGVCPSLCKFGAIKREGR
ncbi:MAG: indolepyruvate ferredoxin oxidoreductase subunit alpha [Actinomycetota bacterium]|nr:indolepyruvate ferredoxin oxidoreductase subunit alpha [Actinomycetota bacterium]